MSNLWRGKTGVCMCFLTPCVYLDHAVFASGVAGLVRSAIHYAPLADLLHLRKERKTRRSGECRRETGFTTSCHLRDGLSFADRFLVESIYSVSAACLLAARALM